MSQIIAYCGINCETCPLYIATLTNDPSAKEEIAVKWGGIYKRAFTLSEMECLGCKSDRRFFLSGKCDISTCNINKGIDTCSKCNEYPCSRIKKFFDWQDKNDTQVKQG